VIGNINECITASIYIAEFKVKQYGDACCSLIYSLCERLARPLIYVLIENWTLPTPVILNNKQCT